MGFQTDKINNRRGKRIRWNSEYPLGSLGRDDYNNGESFYFMLGTWLEETEQLTDDDSAELVMRLEDFVYNEIQEIRDENPERYDYESEEYAFK